MSTNPSNFFGTAQPVRCTFQKTIDLQLFTLEPYTQVRLRKATCARSCSENHRSSHLENRFGRILRSQVFRTLTKACVYMTISRNIWVQLRRMSKEAYSAQDTTKSSRLIQQSIRMTAAVIIFAMNWAFSQCSASFVPCLDGHTD